MTICYHINLVELILPQISKRQLGKIFIPSCCLYILYNNRRRINPYLQYYIGCSGWSYSAWQGPFYPANMNNSSDWLRYYASVFDYVEIDSSFYRMPNLFMVKNWFKKTPEHFRFTAKFPKVITHDKHLKNASKELEHFHQTMLPLKDKILALLIQLPPSLKITEGIENMRQHIVPELDNSN